MTGAAAAAAAAAAATGARGGELLRLAGEVGGAAAFFRGRDMRKAGWKNEVMGWRDEAKGTRAQTHIRWELSEAGKEPPKEFRAGR